MHGTPQGRCGSLVRIGRPVLVRDGAITQLLLTSRVSSLGVMRVQLQGFAAEAHVVGRARANVQCLIGQVGVEPFLYTCRLDPRQLRANKTRPPAMPNDQSIRGMKPQPLHRAIAGAIHLGRPYRTAALTA